MAPSAEPAWRLFVAVPLPDALRDGLATTVASLRALPDAANWRWTDPEGWHITLAFLGATDPARVPDLADALERAVQNVPAFAARAGGLGAFPSPRSARVLWYGVADPDGQLRRLAAAVSKAVGLDAGRFRAHVTLARARERFGSPADALIDAVPVPAGLITVAEAVLYRSHLGRGPARYEALHRAALATPVAGATR